MKEQQKCSKTVSMVAGLIMIMLLLACFLVTLAFSSPGKNTVQAAVQTDTAVKKLIAAAVTEEPVKLTSVECGALLTVGVKNAFQGENLRISAVQCQIQPNHKVLFYMPVTLRGMNFWVNAQAELGCIENRLFAKFTSVQLGRLPIRPEWAVSGLKGALPAGITAQGDALYMDSSALSEKILRGAVTVQVNKLQVTDDSILLELRADKEELRKQIQNELNRLLGLAD